MKLLIVLWLLATAVVLVLAVRRLALSWHDHMILKAHPANFEYEHLKLQSRIGTVDEWGEILTLAVFVYGVALVLFVAYQIVDEAIRKLGQLIRLL